MSKDLYDILEVETDASPEEIKQAYKDRSKSTHPDRGGTDQAFNEVNKAYMVLKNPAKRQRYDRGEPVDSDDVKQQAFVSVAISSFKNALSQVRNSYKTVDILEVSREIIRKDNHEVGRRIKGVTQAISVCEEVIKRLGRKHEGANLLKSVLENDLRQMKNDLNDMEHTIEMNNEAIVFLAEFVYEIDKVEEPEIKFNSSFIGGFDIKFDLNEEDDETEDDDVEE